MITNLKIYEGDSFNPHYNLAVEEYLLENVKSDTCILYLWQNENTVVIGRNQNPWKECKVDLLKEEGGLLARRLSGGGAVFHDSGNLNFTFLMPQQDYDLDKQLSVIQEAVKRCGIETERSGRNDILAEGRKFSGNAFYKNGTQAYHHGTILVCADHEKLGRYLSPSKAKLQSKGVDSVRSRVINLSELRPETTVSVLKEHLAEAFSDVYGIQAEKLHKEDLDAAVISKIHERNASWEWNFGRKLPFSYTYEDRCEWGEVQIHMEIDNGVIQSVKVYSDAMDWEIASCLEERLKGRRFSEDDIKEQLKNIR